MALGIFKERLFIRTNLLEPRLFITDIMRQQVADNDNAVQTAGVCFIQLVQDQVGFYMGQVLLFHQQVGAGQKSPHVVFVQGAEETTRIRAGYVGV